MAKSLKSSAFLALLATAATGLADDRNEASKGSKEIHEIMLGSAKKSQSMEMSGDTDKDFATSMADHHRSGIKMAKAELESGKSPALKALAQKIVEAQQKELTILESHASMSH